MPYNSNQIGYQNNEASFEASQFNTDGKLTLREQVLKLFEQHKELTVEQVSNLLQRPEISVQPRVSELKTLGLIQNSGRKKMGKWGTSVTIWELV